MTTKFNIGDEVYIKALIINIQIDVSNQVSYKVRLDDSDGRTGFLYMRENDILKKEDMKCPNK